MFDFDAPSSMTFPQDKMPIRCKLTHVYAKIARACVDILLSKIPRGNFVTYFAARRGVCCVLGRARDRTWGRERTRRE